LGEVELQVGDTLLLVGRPVGMENCHDDFVLVSAVSSQKIRFDPVRMVIAPLCNLGMVAVASAELTNLLTASLMCMTIVYITGCITFDQMKNAVNVPILITIAASFALANSLETWGVAKEWAHNLLSITEFAGNYGIILGVYIGTCILTAFLSNASSAAVMVPICIELASSTDISLLALAVTIMTAASADFSTPIGYQTNLMVWGLGGYEFLDYTKFGVPLQIILAFFASFLIVTLYPIGDENSTG
jgi:di/tricarboxylate transporter